MNFIVVMFYQIDYVKSTFILLISYVLTKMSYLDLVVTLYYGLRQRPKYINFLYLNTIHNSVLFPYTNLSVGARSYLQILI